jgi:hypothetical protein
MSEVPKEEKFAERLFKDSTRIGGRGMFKIKDDFYHLDINLIIPCSLLQGYHTSFPRKWESSLPGIPFTRE